jgi:hypothetical protein
MEVSKAENVWQGRGEGEEVGVKSVLEALKVLSLGD